MLISEQIARLIEEMIDQGKGSANVRRNDLAQTLGCVPSQISYVISSRFTPQRGYVTESRRGGGGYIKIVRVPMTKDQYLTHFFYAVGSQITKDEAEAYIRNLRENDVISAREAGIMAGAVSDHALEKIRGKKEKDSVRADVMRQIIITLMN